MFSKKGLVLIAAGSLLATACTSFKSASGELTVRNIASINTWKNGNASEAPSSVIANLSSTGHMPLNNAKLITDNNRAFQSKLEIVRNAKRELRMVYFIYSDDFSSSVFNTEVLAAAKRGVKVRLLVDFITNYERLDLFSYLESAGQGNIEVRFYGLPTDTILRGAVYQTVPCSKGAAKSPDQCQSEKMALINQLGNPQSTWFSKMYLTGLYGKNAALMQVAVGLGGQFDPKTYKEGQPSAEQKAQLKSFAKLVFAAKMKNDLMAKIKVGIALQTYGNTLNPIMSELTGRLPLVGGNLPDWNHITDYTHHKLIVADGEKFQLGGRNIEDSYHSDSITSQIKDSKGKYTFMDTDFYGETQGSRNVELSFDRLFNFGAMVGGLKKVEALVPNEYDVNSDQFKMSLGACLQEGKATASDLESCVGNKLPGIPGYKTVAARMDATRNNMTIKSQRFASEYKVKTDKSWKANGDTVEVNGAEAYYLENLSFTGNNPNQRLFGSTIGLEAENGKYLHSAWLKGLENVCATSTKSRQNKRVVLHTAYLFLSSGLTNALGNMMNGKWKCHYVDVVMLTNSFQTTDLNVINIFARYQMQALLGYNQMIENNAGYVTANQNKARFRYFEYAPSREGNGVSLHSKVSVLGDDMIVGSANADVRSYFMDTNNGVYVRNMPQMIADYTAFIDRIISEKQVLDYTNYYANVTNEQLLNENKAILQAMLQKFDAKGRVSAQRQSTILGYVNEMGSKIRSTTRAIVDAPATINGMNNGESGGSQADKFNMLEKLANDFDNMWKVL